MSQNDCKQLLNQLPASLLFKCVDEENVYANSACLQLFTSDSPSDDFLQELKFYDAKTKRLLVRDEHPFEECANSQLTKRKVRITSPAKNLNCVIKGSLLKCGNQQWIVLYLTNVQDNDLSNQKPSEDSPLANHLAFNRLLSQISSQLINVSSERLDDLIEKKLGAFGEFCGVDRCYFFQFSDDKTLMDNTHEWVAPGITPYKDELKGLTIDDLPYFNKILRSEHVFKVDDVSQLPASAALEKAEFQRENIGAVLCAAVYLNEELFGFIGCDIVGTSYEWREHDILYLKLIGEIISNTLANMSNKQSLERVTVQLAEANKQLEHQANFDGLTGIANRRQFDHKLEIAIRRGTREQGLISLLIVDVDHFKRFNDSFGHAAGDEALKKVANALESCCGRCDDLAARYGGEEFAVILPETNNNQAYHVAEKIMQAIEALEIPFSTSPDSDVLTASIGITTQLCNATLSNSKLISLADKALYQAKEKGRNRIEVFQ